MNKRIVKTVFTYTILHPENVRIDSIEQAIAEAFDGDAVGQETDSRSQILTNPKEIEKELVELGNDGDFFND